MEKHQLAQELRQRQYRLDLLDRRLIEAISDDEIIDTYITCSDCGEKQVTIQELKTVIRLAVTVQQFFDFCDRMACTRPTTFAPTRRAKARVRR
jgi:hypothetical protein